MLYKVQPDRVVVADPAIGARKLTRENLKRLDRLFTALNADAKDREG